MKTEIKTPTTPNFFQVTVGKNAAVTVPISEFSEEQLKEIGEKWTKDLIMSAQKRRNNTL